MNKRTHPGGNGSSEGADFTMKVNSISHTGSLSHLWETKVSAIPWASLETSALRTGSIITQENIAEAYLECPFCIFRVYQTAANVKLQNFSLNTACRSVTMLFIAM